MNTAQMVANPSKPSKPCNCGCSDCQGDCCSLECLIRPNFFCGQLLTDRDLKAFVDWISAKSACSVFAKAGASSAASKRHAATSKTNTTASTSARATRSIAVAAISLFAIPSGMTSSAGHSPDPCCREKSRRNTRRQDALTHAASGRYPRRLHSLRTTSRF